ncbi:MAG: hypothetical protein JF887_10900 [Candidatus Dormibacteraeota bacterium]|uniref:Uncharacterized protein n=1 Tax=Candidatus Amunia macphersoniae TaxID=3127014 RepID=A0A934KP17_9BACT|nr:hypothetical protein [Candidatus Dormibacteraeota bacterium]
MTEPFGLDPSRIVGDVSRLLASSLGEVVPPEAQLHLLNAQRELLLALAVIIEHNSTRTPRRPRARRPSAAQAAPRRPERVELD